ncbi:cupin domain-containing protein [Candidatus Microgenomates bacterium]|nr:MAG: cupin domain-containing protein [Candidatus Microgenomates bacterium]
MKITRKQDALSIIKSEGIKVLYYLFPEYEIHYNEQEPNSTQTWHHHEKIWESLYIIEGELTAKWQENGEIKTQIVKAGDLIETENSPHTFINNSNNIIKFLVLKQVLSGENKKELLKTDKVID